jgi:hypothetical protein
MPDTLNPTNIARSWLTPGLDPKLRPKMVPPFKEPPPYSAEDIKLIIDPDEQLWAMAELSNRWKRRPIWGRVDPAISGYIARVKELKAEGLAHGVDSSDGYVGYDSSTPPC